MILIALSEHGSIIMEVEDLLAAIQLFSEQLV